MPSLLTPVAKNRHVQTDMGDQGARLMGRKEAPTTLEDSVRGICTRVCPLPEFPSKHPYSLSPDPLPECCMLQAAGFGTAHSFCISLERSGGLRQDGCGGDADRDSI